MPANLTPDYLAADRKFKEATTPQAKLAALEEMLATVPKHKGTEKMQADIKRRIAKLREETQRKRGTARGKPAYYVDKEGAGQVALVGAPNVGKSMLLRALTNAEAEVGDYPFTTRLPQPGMAAYENVQIQLVDLPPISQEFTEAWLYAIIRGTNAALFVVDLASPDLVDQTEAVLGLLAQANITLVRGRPRAPQQKQAIVVANKLDTPRAAEQLAVLRAFMRDRLPILPASARTGTGVEALRPAMFEMLDVIRVYSKPPGRKVDLTAPFILKKGATVLEAAATVHKDFVAKLKYARLWGRNEYQGQMIGRDHVLEDGDIVELHA